MPNEQIPADDKTIVDDAILWRNIPPWHVILDKNAQTLRPSKAAFDDHPNGSPMSVTLAELVLESGRGPQDVINGLEGFKLSSFPVSLARSLGQGMERKPLEQEPAHAEVFGPKPESVRRKLAKGSQWVIGPEEVGATSQPT
jgi:hypothetical protein